VICTGIALTFSLLGQVAAGAVSHIEWLGQAKIPGGARIEGEVVGGLSGITFDAMRGVFYVVTDDPSARGPARFFTVEIDLTQEKLTDEAVKVVASTVIQSPDGGAIEKLTVDPEGIGLHPDGSLFISSEGQIERQVGLFVRQYSVDGEFLAELPLARRYLPSADGSSGPRHNLGLESLAISPDGRYLFTALENALIQDGPEAALGVPSPSRLLQYDLEEGRLEAEFVYMTDPLAVASSVPDGTAVNGLVDLLALDSNRLLSMERSFSMGVGNTIKLFRVDTTHASDIQAHESLAGVDPGERAPVEKHLLLDLGELGVYLDNLEGMTLGPVLGDGRQTLILVSDDNFNPLVQTTQIFAFALGSGPMGVEQVQGADHRSPIDGQWVSGVEGVVTGIYAGRDGGFWIESNSRGVLVSPTLQGFTPSVGDRVAIDGRVVETQRSGELSVTTLQPSRVVSLASDEPRTPPVAVGPGGRRVPGEVVEDDGLRVFEPQFDGIDFWESLEGMRIELTDPLVVGPTNRYGELAVDAGGNPTETGRTHRGGLLLRPGDLNPERPILDFSGLGGGLAANVGDRFQGALVGIVDYRFGRYRLQVQEPLPRLQRANHEPEVTRLRGAEDVLTIATFNVMNLSAINDQERFRSLSQTLTQALGAPDVVALQEIQDDTGPEDDGQVGATRTLERLIAEVEANGGPRYEYTQIDPMDGRDGGQRGANIRVVFLFNPTRVIFKQSGRPTAETPVRVVRGGERPGLSVNPGRIEPQAAAFGGDKARGFSASRKSLVGEFHFGPEKIFVVNNHLTSKSADTRVFGQTQPPLRHSEDQRSQQASWVARFAAEILERDPQAGVVVLGDFNEHEFRPAMRILTAEGLVNLTERIEERDRYTFNYRGNSQLLDHILVSRLLLERVEARVDIVHANVDFSHDHRSSDHDPVLVQLDFGWTE
jgi:predicted extracellular nuclease